MSMQTYLQQTFLSITEGKAFDTSVTPLNLCCLHYMQIICKDEDATYLLPKEKSRLKEILAAPFLFNDYNTVRTCWSKLVVILISKTTSAIFQTEFSELITICTNSDNKLTIDDVTDDLLVDSDSTTVQYKLSPFYKDFKCIYTSVM